MTTIAVAVLLGLAVLAIWLACVGFLRLGAALDRLHCVAFVNTAAGSAVTVAVIIQDGLTDRAFKTLILWAVMVLGGAALSHAAGRALVQRGGVRQ